jgi:hypothetical protein
MMQPDYSALAGNAPQYDFSHIELREDSPLQGKHLCILGSSVVQGWASLDSGVGEYLAARLGMQLTKSAVGGTTLVEEGEDNYILRLNNLDKNVHFDVFIVQLSTNDVRLGKPLGEIGTLDTHTVTGAIETIVRTVRDTWNCPVYFFTGSRFDAAPYAAMVQRLMELAKMYGFGVLDLWTGDAFNNVPDAQRSIYMADPVHPTKAGYRDWWGPELEAQLLRLQAQE